jgi:hypothetical protein
MIRREFITLLGGAAAAWPLAARAQEVARTYRLGFLLPTARQSSPVEAFFDELRINGFVEGSIRQVNMTISLAFLAPDLVKAAVEGRLPRGIGVTRLRDAPAEWSRQYAMLGLSI